MNYVTGVTTGNAVEWWDFDFVELNPVTHLYGDWKMNGNGKYEPDLEGECAFIYDNNSNYIQVVWSKYVMRCKPCSPCFSGQGDLDSPAGKYDWTQAYCLPPDVVYRDWIKNKTIVEVSEMGDKLMELFQDTNSLVTPNRDFVIVYDKNDIQTIETLANKRFPGGNDGEPWTFDSIVNEITGNSDWGFSDEYGYCAHCYRVIDYYNHFYRDYWIDYEACEELCCDCVRDEFPEDYLRSIVNNPDEIDGFLGSSKLKEFGFELLHDVAYWRYSDRHSLYNKLRERYEYDDIVFGERDPQNGAHKWTVWVRNASNGES